MKTITSFPEEQGNNCWVRVPMQPITELLAAVDRGEAGAADRLFPLVYKELRALAAARLAKEPPGHTLDPTALVHEAYLRIPGNQRFDHRGHFFSAAAEAMRRILVDSARRKKNVKHGGQFNRHNVDALPIAAPESDDELIALDEALDEFAQSEPLKAEVVKLRYFVGLTIAETAEALGISPATAKRHWIYSRAWLCQRVRGDDQGG